jgi:hypothetical protein
MQCSRPRSFSGHDRFASYLARLFSAPSLPRAARIEFHDKWLESKDWKIAKSLPIP